MTERERQLKVIDDFYEKWDRLHETFTLGAVMDDKAKKKKWMGTWPTRCDICHYPLTEYKWFVDGRLRNQTCWALMCPPCSYSNSAGLGLGVGQKYDSKTLEKLEG